MVAVSGGGVATSALSLLHQEGARWDPKASERLQEVQFIIFNGEEQEVGT